MKKILFLLLIIHYSLFTAQAQWQKTSGPTGWGEQVNCLAVRGDTVFTGTNGGVFLSSDNGATWVSLGLGTISCLAISRVNIYAGTDAGIYLSTNNGTTWSKLSKLVPSCFAINGANIFAGTPEEGVFLSTDKGSSWIAINNGLTNIEVVSLALRGDTIFAGTNFGGIFLSSNNGASWKLVGLQNNDVYEIAISKENIFAATDEDVFLSTNNGASWTPVNKGLNDSNYVGALAIIGTNIFAGTGGGADTCDVFLSTDNGGNWACVGYLNYQISSFVTCGGYIFTGTVDGGVWKRALWELGIGINEPVVQSSMFKVQCFPNPVNQSSVISYQLSKNSQVNISIYDITGRKAATLLNEVKCKGEYNLKYNAEKLSSGVYFIKLTFNNGSIVKKFIKANNF